MSTGSETTIVDALGQTTVAIDGKEDGFTVANAKRMIDGQKSAFNWL